MSLRGAERRGNPGFSALASLYAEAKKAIRVEFTADFLRSIPGAIPLATQAETRDDYILHPAQGEKLSEKSAAALEKLRDSWQGGLPYAQVVISDGLNALSIMDPEHVLPYIAALRKGRQALPAAPQISS